MTIWSGPACDEGYRGETLDSSPCENRCPTRDEALHADA